MKAQINPIIEKIIEKNLNNDQQSEDNDDYLKKFYEAKLIGKLTYKT